MPPSLQIATADESRRQPPSEVRWPDTSVPSHAVKNRQAKLPMHSLVSVAGLQRRLTPLNQLMEGYGSIPTTAQIVSGFQWLKKLVPSCWTRKLSSMASIIY